MKGYKVITIILSLLFTQHVSQAQRHLQFSDIYMMGGLGATFTSPLETWEINNLERGNFNRSGLNLSQKSYNGDKSALRLSTQMGLMAGWNIKNAKLGNQKLRLGFSAGIYNLNWSNDYYQQNTYRIDTLVSQQTGELYPIDSTHIKYLSYQHLAQMFNLHVDYLVYFNPENKLTFYSGIGARAGISLSNNVTTNYYEYNSTDEMDHNDKKYYERKNYSIDNGYYETNSLSPIFNLNVAALVGLNYRLSKRNKFLSHVHLFHELRLGLEVNQMQEIDPSIGFNIGTQSGLRISL